MLVRRAQLLLPLAIRDAGVKLSCPPLIKREKETNSESRSFDRLLVLTVSRPREFTYILAPSSPLT